MPSSSCPGFPPSQPSERGRLKRIESICIDSKAGGLQWMKKKMNGIVLSYDIVPYRKYRGIRNS